MRLPPKGPFTTPRAPVRAGAEASHAPERIWTSPPERPARGTVSRAFTLIELLIVIGIIGILAAIGLPALKGLQGSNDLGAANRQLLDDLSYARFKAINDRTTVYVVFVSPEILRQAWNPAERREIAKYARLQFTSYALFANRTLGDQPGPGTPRYLTEWRSLPEGTFIPTNKFDLASEPNRLKQPPITRTLQHYLIPFPYATNKAVPLPCIAFDYQGGLKQTDDAALPIAKGSIIYPQETKPDSLEFPEVIETPKGNYTNNPVIVIDWLTGRARNVQPGDTKYAALLK